MFTLFISIFIYNQHFHCDKSPDFEKICTTNLSIFSLFSMRTRYLGLGVDPDQVIFEQIAFPTNEYNGREKLSGKVAIVTVSIIGGSKGECPAYAPTGPILSFSHPFNRKHLCQRLMPPNVSTPPGK